MFVIGTVQDGVTERYRSLAQIKMETAYEDVCGPTDAN